MIKVVVNGALGKMGKEVVNAVKASTDMELIQECDINNSLDNYLSKNSVDVVVDFTRPEARMENVKTILNHGAAGVIGTTGFTDEDLEEIKKLCKKNKKGIIVAPNFAIGTILQMHFSRIAAKYFDTAEIVEYHHNQKADFPSGTAIKTAQLMAKERELFNPKLNDVVSNLDGARGADFKGIHIHSVRLPGMVAHQEVIFGEKGQYLTIRHDAVSRECYMSGVLMSIREVVKIDKLIYGLESLLGL
ncbi:MAG: 4-hydroxy-tetrahydrodipicolinate reductase [Candidatus Margulisbacteria bacterium GWF2_35_9]|nr:MAG: 4-hydroxy-tetrahydrodipicolinate reductase [Candidatus Margulisbacteria bacterium GWF2_35_9]